MLTGLFRICQAAYRCRAADDMPLGRRSYTTTEGRSGFEFSLLAISVGVFLGLGMFTNGHKVCFGVRSWHIALGSFIC